VNSLTLVREHNAGSARLSTADRTDQSDRVDVLWHCHAFDYGTFPLQADVQFRSIAYEILIDNPQPIANNIYTTIAII